jgi:hypothetical protein
MVPPGPWARAEATHLYLPAGIGALATKLLTIDPRQEYATSTSGCLQALSATVIKGAGLAGNLRQRPEIGILDRQNRCTQCIGQPLLGAVHDSSGTP